MNDRPIVSNKKSVDGKKVFVGIDVHARTYRVAALVEGEVLKSWTCPANPGVLIDTLNRLCQGAESVEVVYEAGFSGFSLHRALEGAGFSSIVVNPASLETAANDRVKTDKKDAKKLALHLSQGRLKGIRIPSESEELERQAHRTRSQLVSQRKRVMNQIRSKFHQFGILGCEDKSVLREKRVLKLLEDAPEALKAVINPLLRVWQTYNEEIDNLNLIMKRQSQAPEALDELYQSIPGVGPIGSRILSSELGDMSQFKNERALASFVGLTPTEHSSGDKTRKGHISRQGSSRLRGMLVEAAWTAITKDEILRQYYAQLTIRAGAKRAIVAVARKLLLRARAIAKTGEVYQVTEQVLEVAA